MVIGIIHFGKNFYLKQYNYTLDCNIAAPDPLSAKMILFETLSSKIRRSVAPPPPLLLPFLSLPGGGGATDLRIF